MMAGVLPVYSEWYWTFCMGKGSSEREVRLMFDFFYSKTRYRQYQQLNNSLAVLIPRPPRQMAFWRDLSFIRPCSEFG